MSKKQKKMLTRILAAAVLLVVVKLLPEIRLPIHLPLISSPAAQNGTMFSLAPWLLYLVPYLIIGWDVLARSLRNIANGQVFDENFLMALATVGAFGTGEYAEAVFVMLFYQVGELFQDYAVGKSRQSIAALMDIRPDTANLEGENGEIQEVDPEEVSVGSIVVIKPGQRVPLDGVVVEGTSALDTAALTGESVPRDVVPGDAVISGCVNQTGLLRVKVTRESGESTVSKILDLVENASEKKSTSENFITRFARYYTPCVVIAALALFLIPTLALALTPAASQPAFLLGTTWSNWLHRALIFLVISCPCALVISVPLSFFGGIGGASKCGILVKGGNYLEALAKTETVIFDKTGTLTRGTFTVTAVHPESGFTREQLLEDAALAERYSDHPISLSLQAACTSSLDAGRVSGVEEIAGHGVLAQVDGRRVAVGNRRLMERQGVSAAPCELPGTIVYVAVDGAYAGHIVISDLPKEDAKAAIADLKANGVKKTVMLTGDTEAAAKAVAAELGVDEYHAELLPADKVEWMERLLASSGGKTAFVGDGINDAPVLTRADIGIAMGALGSDAAIEAADIVLMDDKPSKIATAMRISRKTLRIAHQNIWFALIVKFAVMILGAFDLATMWEAVFADVGVAFIAILNATRCLKTEEFRS
ncbi:cadmium-translocating P-type ATPase [Dysosmobacter sp. NSJ-60]|uniref:Cd(2+)-exporting ATPase n=1 Tax=Pusillibacter faecalis TaxID=2714358 RepID=A0A810Q793_9FIRM|nr:heavy metal translocating P-type ATPase [Pusillibacter faecalis]MBC5747656.1 cadmium-translocating P-type ATPase [Dysosmobacter hominis]MBS5657288.1 cadmium-translocating P-type ATPase [Oscillibacter sp.]MCQ5027827.1 heavy metal translocating P-type ATPase [Oscillibacter valericigenes]BCK84158.1 cadmium-translocating P-type ATPase [Pusillibacter faecalis]